MIKHESNDDFDMILNTDKYRLYLCKTNVIRTQYRQK